MDSVMSDPIFMIDPSSTVDRQLLPHLHLLLNVQFPRPQPIHGGLPVDKVIEFLLHAVRFTRSEKTVSWQFLNGPPDGTISVAWQPPSMKTEFSSDGYVYADPERAFSQQVRGYTVEMHIQRAGFRLGDRYTSHCRRRFRIKITNPNMPQNPHLPTPDESLWLIQWTGIENPQDRIPTEKVALSPEIKMLQTQRVFVGQQELVRKEFMLHDRGNWPKISLPRPPNVGFVQQNVAYPDMVGAPLEKRPHPVLAGPQRSMAAGSSPNLTKSPKSNIRSGLEEDTAIGDVMDYLTPREISHARFTQHAEWMEELFSSPYETGCIVPSELGLGRKGELEGLTGAFFDAPTQVRTTAAGPVGRMEGDKADGFRKSVRESLARIDADIKEMKRKHAQEIAEIQNGSPAKQCLQQLQQGSVIARRDYDFTGLLSRFETSTGKNIKVFDKSKCIQQGGLMEQTLQDQRAARAPDQQGLLPSRGPKKTPESSQSPFVANEEDATAALRASPHVIQTTSDVTLGPIPDSDVQMESSQVSTQGPAAPQDDWVIVGRDDSAGQQTDTVPRDTSVLSAFGEAPSAQPDIGDVGLPTDQEVCDFPVDAVPETGGAFDTTTFDDSVHFGNLDTAGEALAGYEPGDVDLSLGEHGDMGLEDSAFGDAYHADTGTSPGQDQKMPGSEMQQ